MSSAYLKQNIKNLKQNGIQPEQILADTGYSSAEALQFCKENNIDAYIPNFGQYKPEREGFIYNEDKNQYECTRGNRAVLPFKRVITDSKGYDKKIYRSDNSKCKNCPLRSECIGKSDFKKIEDAIGRHFYDEMHQKLQTVYAKKIMKKRGSTVEPVLGTMLNFLNLKRVNTRGIKQANKHVMMAAMAYNLKKYLKFISKKSIAKTVAMKGEVPALLQINFYGFINSFLSLEKFHFR